VKFIPHLPTVSTRSPIRRPAASAALGGLTRLAPRHEIPCVRPIRRNAVGTAFTLWGLVGPKVRFTRDLRRYSEENRAMFTNNSPDRRTLLRFLAAGALLGLGWSQSAAASEVTAPVEQLCAGLTTIMKAGKNASFRQRFETIAPVIGRTFDIQAILRQIIGPRWGSLPADQQSALADAFRRYTIASYVANFDIYSGQRFDISPAVRAIGNDRVVETRIATPGGKEHALDYVLRQESGSWKVVDVLAEGSISRVASQRSEMRSLLADGSGAGLLVSLRQKTAELSGGIVQ
jgi:phospholipid transport system substrate-binding protein